MSKKQVKNEHPVVAQWWNDENFQKFQRQAQLDMFTGVKNGVKGDEIKRAFDQFIKKFENSCAALFK